MAARAGSAIARSIVPVLIGLLIAGAVGFALHAAYPVKSVSDEDLRMLADRKKAIADVDLLRSQGKLMGSHEALYEQLKKQVVETERAQDQRHAGGRNSSILLIALAGLMLGASVAGRSWPFSVSRILTFTGFFLLAYGAWMAIDAAAPLFRYILPGVAAVIAAAAGYSEFARVRAGDGAPQRVSERAPGASGA